MAKCNCVYEEFCKLVNGGGIILPKPCAYRKDSTDYVEVVRCKDCKHRENLMGELCCPYYDDLPVKDEHFCAYGERRDGE